MPAFDLFPAIAAFSRVAHHSSFSRAARELGVSPSALSQTVRSLEARLGVRLLERSTRRVGLTELGQRFLEATGASLGGLEQAIAEVAEWREAPAGLLRLNVSDVAAQLLIMPHLAAFMAAYPQVIVDLHCDNNLVDLVGGGFDAGIRLGESLAHDVVAVPLGGSLRGATFAAPAYLARHGAPRVPADLLLHRCACPRLGNGQQPMRWEYQQGEQWLEVQANPAMITNTGSLLLDTARAGAAIGCYLEPAVRADFAAGTLVPVLEPWWPSYGGFYLYYPSRVLMPRKLRVFIDFISARQRV
ncbi:LysR substrate-binding domain-containing protein [Pseudomonas sp. NPDC007930]|uniref:LysR substrate-binding domain-containing protein n=1 Tax=Pseudomonas sp. NPDC007930 TaxID=3364417 RepID=UPI0036E8DA7A